MKRVCSAFCILGMIGSASLAAEVAVTIGCWNIQIGKGMDKQFDLERTVAALERFESETIAFNEVDCRNARTQYVDMPRFFSEKTGMYVIFSAARVDPPEGLYGNMVLSRYPLELKEAFLVPSTPDETRGALLVKVAAPSPYYLLTTHLSYQQTPEAEAIRIQAIDRITERLADYTDLPLILAGDLNSRDNSAPLDHLRWLGYKLANDLAPEPTFPASKPDRTLDYIATAPGSDAALLEFRVLPEKEASDHRPIEAIIRLSPPTRSPE